MAAAGQGAMQRPKATGVFEHLVAPLERIAVVAIGKSVEVPGVA